MTAKRNFVVFGVGVATALLAGWFALPRALYSRHYQPLAFHHKTHAEKSGVADCSQCHALRNDGSFAGVPSVEICASCHSERIGQSHDEAILVDRYVKPGQDLPWLIYARQPANVWFSHAVHVRGARLACNECHSDHGESDEMPAYEQNRISGYSRDIEGRSILRIRFGRRDGMKMTDCERCHRGHGVQVGCFGCHQ